MLIKLSCNRRFRLLVRKIASDYGTVMQQRVEVKGQWINLLFNYYEIKNSLKVASLSI